ncbi:MAG: DUF5119 domain-containing protein [Muribaculaceae bacterium]|nr:DUF5119 domain-containing protein [Muribaculaceae bacterium]
MNIIKKYYTIALALMAVSLLTACERTELCYDHYPTLTLSMEWEQEWERDYGMNHIANWEPSKHGREYDDLRPQQAEWINMLIRRTDGSVSEKYIHPEGDVISAELNGGQSYMFYNGDTEYILFSDLANPDDAKASATSRSRSGLAFINENHPDARSTNSPDILYASYIENVPSLGVHEHPTLNVKMQPVVYTYIIRYEFDYGLEHVALARGAIGGMAAYVYLKDGHTSDETSIILYDCEVKSYGCEAEIRSFGTPGFPDEYYGRSNTESQDKKYTLNLEILLSNGKSVEFNYDISDQLKKQPRGGVITVSGVRIEDQIGDSESGFAVDVTDWPNHDIIDLPIEIEP